MLILLLQTNIGPYQVARSDGPGLSLLRGLALKDVCVCYLLLIDLLLRVQAGTLYLSEFIILMTPIELSALI